MEIALETPIEHIGHITPDIDTIIFSLREELESLKQDRAREMESSSETISRKNIELNTQRVKLKQYEFALQESLVFLAKPLNKYDEWINSESIENVLFEFAKNIPTADSKRYSYHGAQSTATDPMQKIQSTPAPKLTKSNTVTSSSSFQKVIPKVLDLTKLEINCLESMRLCFNFLKSCQKFNLAIDNGSFQIPSTPPTQPLENESMALFDLQPEQVEPPPVEVVTQSFIKSPTTKVEILVEDEGDMSLEPLEDFKSTRKPQCDRCHKNLLLLDTFKDKLKDSETRTDELESRLTKEIAARKICQQAKEMIDQEIEDITSELFLRANQMVIDESKRMDALNTSNRELTKRAIDLTTRLREKENELSLAVQTLYNLQSTQMGVQDYTTPNVVVVKPITTEYTFAIVSGFDRFKSSIAADGVVFQEFQDLVKVMVASTTLASGVAFTAIQNTQYIKRCVFESIEPTLFYVYKLGSGMSNATKKKLSESCIRGTVGVTFNEESTSKQKCTVCMLNRTCEYNLTFCVPVEKATAVCRCCRDRLMSVQDFYNLIAFLSTGKHGSTILAMFRQVTWTRRRMALAVVGSCSLFETEVSAIVGPGSGGSWERMTKISY